MKTIKTTSLTSSDPTVCLPTEIHLLADGAVACHADSGDVTYDSLEDLCDDYGLDIDELNIPVDAEELSAAMRSKDGGLAWRGKVLTLTQPAYVDGYHDEPLYCASARDAEGNVYAVRWSIKPEIQRLPADEWPEDESCLCDWDDPTEVRLVEAA